MSHFLRSNVLVTGGAGFIGSRLVERLVEEGARVTVVDSLIPEYGGNLRNLASVRDRINLNIADVRDPYSMKYLVKERDYLFNLAGQTSHLDSMVDPFLDLQINAQAQLSILEAVRHYNPAVKIVFASTRQVYGRPAYFPVDELHSCSPIDVNGINKLAGESYHLLYQNYYGIRATVLRLTNTFGPGMRVKDARQTFLGLWFRRLLEDEPILVYGDGAQIRDFTYVDDCVDALLAVAETEITNGQIFNLGADETISLKDLAQLAVEIHGEGRFELFEFPKDLKGIDIGNYYGTYAKLNKTVGWRPKVSLRTGIETTLRYYKENQTHYW